MFNKKNSLFFFIELMYAHAVIFFFFINYIQISFEKIFLEFCIVKRPINKKKMRSDRYL